MEFVFVAYMSCAVFFAPTIVCGVFHDPLFSWQRRVPNFVTLLIGLLCCVFWLPLVIWSFSDDIARGLRTGAIWLVSKPRGEER